MPNYRVLNKHIYRASIVPTRMGTKPDGSPDIVEQPGPMERVEVGTVLDNVSDAELRAFPDRFGAVDERAEAEAVPDTTQATIAARGAARGAASAGPIPEGTTAEQAAAATAARMHPATVTAQDQAIGATEETAQPGTEESQRGTSHRRRGASD